MNRLRAWWSRYLAWRARPSGRRSGTTGAPVTKTDMRERDLNKQRLGLSQPPEF